MGDKDEWLNWDYALADALQTIEDNTDKYGLLAWELDDERVDVLAIKRIHKFEQARDQKTKGTEKKPYKPSAGEYFVPKVEFLGREGTHPYTYREWVDAQIAESNN